MTNEEIKLILTEGENFQDLAYERAYSLLVISEELYNLYDTVGLSFNIGYIDVIFVDRTDKSATTTIALDIEDLTMNAGEWERNLIEIRKEAQDEKDRLNASYKQGEKDADLRKFNELKSKLGL